MTITTWRIRERASSTCPTGNPRGPLGRLAPGLAPSGPALGTGSWLAMQAAARRLASARTGGQVHRRRSIVADHQVRSLRTGVGNNAVSFAVDR
jgi:hypothetical protein